MLLHLNNSTPAITSNKALPPQIVPQLDWDLAVASIAIVTDSLSNYRILRTPMKRSDVSIDI